MQTEWTMPWKKDLAKLKQDLGKEEGIPAKVTPPPKAAVKHPVSRSIEEEDAIFLNAMGLRSQPSVKDVPVQPAKTAAPQVQPAPEPAPVQVPVPAPKAEFTEAMDDLKGMKPLRRTLPPEKPAPVPPPPAPAVEVPREPPAPVPEVAVEVAPRAPEPPGATQIHLAAGMAIEVDGRLDLKGHARSDAEERLKERLLDGYALGWRTLHVTVGAAEDLRQMVLDLLQTPQGSCVARYAQAPVPMGGAQAWILYFKGLPSSSSAVNADNH